MRGPVRGGATCVRRDATTSDRLSAGRALGLEGVEVRAGLAPQLQGWGRGPGRSRVKVLGTVRRSGAVTRPQPSPGRVGCAQYELTGAAAALRPGRRHRQGTPAAPPRPCAPRGARGLERNGRQ